MCPGLTNNLPQVDDARKTAIIDRELDKLNIDIACLQETRLLGSGSIKESCYTFFWQGRPQGQPKQHGVGFAIKNSMVDAIIPSSEGTERIFSLSLSTSSGPVRLFSIYAPTLTSAPEEKDTFYAALDEAISKVPKTEGLYLLGDFNARVGAEDQAWPSCLGPHGIGKLNENGQRILELCCFHGLCVTNTYFQDKELHKVSWRHPRSRHWHQLDLAITRRKDLGNVLHTRSYHSAVCDTDHSFVVSKVRLAPRKRHHSKQKCRPRVNTRNTNNPERTQEFLSCLEVSLADSSQDGSIESKWHKIRDAVYNCAVTAYGRKEHNNADWLEASWDEMEPVLEAKRQALMNYKKSPSQTSLEGLRAARHHVQLTSRRCANNYWLNLCKSIQDAADIGDTRRMYEGIKKAVGPSTSKVAPLKAKNGEIISDPTQQLERWVEYYLELYATKTHVARSALDSLPDLPILEELDALPTMEELDKALNALASGKAPGADGIPSEVLKIGKPILMQPLYELLCLCWENGYIPQDMRDAITVTLYKNKGDCSDCNNYRGISLLSIAGKAFARVSLSRLQKLASRVYPESQCGFRPGRSTTDMIFSLRQMQEKCREQQMPLYIAFIDLTKAFDLVSRKGLLEILKKIGCPPRLLKIIASFHENTRNSVRFKGATSEAFPVGSGVKQGCVLAPTLFGIFFSLLLQHAFGGCDEGIYLYTRSDGKLFNIARLRAKSKVKLILIRELLFADDAAIVSHSVAHLQRLVDRFAYACKEFGLTISLKKTKVMAQNSDTPPVITIGGQPLEVVPTFTYLGSTVSNSVNLDFELNSRIGKAAGTMAKLNDRVWKNNKLTMRTKLRVYQACVLSSLLYGSETWTIYKRQERRLNSFHLRCLRRVLHIHWQDKKTNSEVLERADIPSIFAILSKRRLTWLGHVYRMDPGRIPKDILYGELAEGCRPVGRPHLRFKDVCKRDMKQSEIEADKWECYAGDRTKWRSIVREGVVCAEKKRRAEQEVKRMRRKQHAASSLLPPTADYSCSSCGKICLSRIGLWSHSKQCRK